MNTNNLIQETQMLQEKWGKLLNDTENFPKFKSAYQKAVTAVMLENQANTSSSLTSLNEAVPPNFSGGLGAGTNVASYDPVMISMIRRNAPLLMAFDVAGVQPMTMPTGLIFALRARYQTGADNNLTDDPEALHKDIKTWFAGAGSDGTVGTPVLPDDEAKDPSVLNDTPAGPYNTGIGMTTLEAEDNNFNEMGFTIERVAVTAKAYQLKAQYTLELQQDLRAVHGLDAETELANILQNEILMEINRQLVRTIYMIAVPGAVGTTTPGIYDLDVDSNGRWSAERFKGLVYQIELEANAISKDTRRGRGNILICTSDVASALQMSGDLDYAPAIEQNLAIDDSVSTFAGTLKNGMAVHIDPYSEGTWFVAGYKGKNAFDAGLFYAPYVPLEMVRATNQDTFQPAIGFKTRFGLVTNPFANKTQPIGTLAPNDNIYYRRVKILNLR